MPATITPAAPPEPQAATLDRNLAALTRHSPGTAALIERAGPRASMTFVATDEGGAISASLDGRWLASRRRPLEEAGRLADSVDIKAHAGVVVMGFGVGHHVEAIARRIARTGLVVVFEPDVALLREVLLRVDFSKWINESNLVVLTDPDDTAAVSAAVEGGGGLLAMGAQIVAHAPSIERLGDGANRFGQTFSRVMSALRTSLVTTLVQTEATVRNVLMNAGRYVTTPGIADLRGVCAGHPAVVVSAGPSLARNIRLLAAPGVRERCVIVAVQTALKPLLEAGIRPHFVTALDYHEISARFYEGLTSADVEGVTLIAEPKANPRILDSFPGAIRCPSDDFFERLLGPEMAPPGARGAIASGATVAHLAYYMARHLGCDPVALIGQDLGFTDGQYYAAGAAIHGVWAGELNPFRTLEMFEWERIARSRGILREAVDHLGRPVYSDEQMMTYLAQFECDFKEDEAKGLLTIDATEGGVRKAHTERMRLADVLEQHASAIAPPLPEIPAAVPLPDGAARLAALKRRLREVRAGVWRVGDLSRRAGTLLEEMEERQADQARVNTLIGRVYELRNEANAIDPGYYLTQRFNQAGALNRLRADRAIGLDEEADGMATQRAQIERDRKNLRWLGDSADALGGLIDHAVRVLDGAPKITRDVIEDDSAGDEGAAKTATRVFAVIPVDLRRGGLGGERSLAPKSGPLAGKSALRLTLERLARCEGLDGAALLTDDADAVRALLGGPIRGLRVEIERVERSGLGERAAGVRACRAWAPECWRGAIGNLSVYDEVLDPGAIVGAMERLGATAALLVGPDWACVDPALTSAVLARHRERPGRHKIVFTQATPGLCGMVVATEIIRDIAEAPGAGQGHVFTSIGGLLGYVPVRPKADPIAQPVCVPAPTSVRDAGMRFIADTAGGRAAIDRAAAALGERFAQAGAEEIVAAAAGAESNLGPRHLVLECCAMRALGGRRLEWARGGAFAGAEAREGARLDAATVRRLVGEAAARRDDVVVSFAGAGDPLMHPAFASLIAAAREGGAMSVHVRTDLVCDEAGVAALLDAGPDVISVDVLTETEVKYAALTGGAERSVVIGNMERLLEARQLRAGAGWLAAPMVVARLTRCDEVYEEVESFYDRWTMICGAAMLDPMPAPPSPESEERIAPLPPPRIAAERAARETRIVLCDGTIAGGPA